MVSALRPPTGVKLAWLGDVGWSTVVIPSRPRPAERRTCSTRWTTEGMLTPDNRDLITPRCIIGQAWTLGLAPADSFDLDFNYKRIRELIAVRSSKP